MKRNMAWTRQTGCRPEAKTGPCFLMPLATLLLLENLDHAGVVALSVLCTYNPAKGLAVFR